MKEYSLAINGNRYTVQIKDVNDECIVADVNGQEYTVDIDQIANISPFLEADEIAIASQPNPAAISNSPSPQRPPQKQQTNSTSPAAPIAAPIPGQIIGINVKVGDKVLKGQKLLTLEAMKLENAITADHDGVVKELYISSGDVVSQGQALIIVE